MSNEDLKTRIADLENQLASLARLTRGESPFPRIFLAKKTDTEKKQWQERTVAGGDVVDFDDGRKSQKDGDDANYIEPEKDDSLLMEFNDGDHKSYVLLEFGEKLIPVLVTNDGGVAGSSSADCTLTYSYTTLDDTDTNLGEGATPLRPRFTHCEYNIPGDGSVGLAYKDGDGVWVLYEAVNEIPKTDTVTYVTQMQVDGATDKIQVKTQEALVLELYDESGWTDVHTGEDCAGG